MFRVAAGAVRHVDEPVEDVDGVGDVAEEEGEQEGAEGEELHLRMREILKASFRNSESRGKLWRNKP